MPQGDGTGPWWAQRNCWRGRGLGRGLGFGSTKEDLKAYAEELKEELAVIEKRLKE